MKDKYQNIMIQIKYIFIFFLYIFFHNIYSYLFIFSYINTINEWNSEVIIENNKKN